jgi:hypothetical protein
MRTLRFLTLMLTALTLGMGFAHLLQMPAKLAYSGPQWLLLQQTLYGDFRVLGTLIDAASRSRCGCASRRAAGRSSARCACSARTPPGGSR